MDEAAFKWRIRVCLRQGGLSRNKVSVGEPADGSPPKKNPEAGDFGPPFPLFFPYRSLLFTPLVEKDYFVSLHLDSDKAV